MSVILKCKKHPAYRAHKQPILACPMCQALWRLAQTYGIERVL